MCTRQWAFSIVCSLTVMTAIGCYSHYPSSVYGPGGQPGGYAVPPGGGYPQGTYVMPGTPGAALGPGTTYESQSPTTSGSDGRWQPNGSSSDAPAYEAPTGGADNPVPDYNDPMGSPAGGGFNETGDFGDTEDFGNQPAPESAPAGGGGAEPSTPFGGESPFGEAAATDTDDGQFVSVESEMMPVTVVTTVEDEASSRPAPSPYKYDREKFEWLRGVIDYDNDARTWNIIYDIEPDPQDQFGGSIVLHGVDRSEMLENGDVVLVDGQVDPQRVDRFGKPTFRVDRLTLLTPSE